VAQRPDRQLVGDGLVGGRQRQLVRLRGGRRGEDRSDADGEDAG
jgi:hypothetical protein